MMRFPGKTRSVSNCWAVSDAEIAFRAFWQAASRLRRLGEVRFAASGLSPAQWRILRSLHEHAARGDNSVRATDLSVELLLNKATVSGLLARLIRMGLVSRTRLEMDQRSRAVALTAEGRKRVASILVDHPGWMEGLMAGLSAPEQRAFAGMLEKLCRWLDPLVERTGSAVVRSTHTSASRRDSSAVGSVQS